uniref:Uncharacterized protein n=1 Tax=Anguilla anguilla TaxID=7936 RepID=A0A0E9QDV2_ANGAN
MKCFSSDSASYQMPLNSLKFFNTNCSGSEVFVVMHLDCTCKYLKPLFQEEQN